MRKMEKSKAREFLIQTLRSVFNLVQRPAWEARALEGNDILGDCEKFGIDPLWMSDFGAGRVSFQWKKEPCFEIDTELEVEVGFGWISDDRRGYNVKVRWPSGGGTPATAVAVASQHLEMAQLACQLDTILSNRLESLRRGCEEETLKELFKELGEKSDVEREKFARGRKNSKE